MSSLIPLIIDKLHDDLHTAIASSERAHQSAIDKQNIPENKYDTLALEAAYLAHGQSLRIEALQAAVLVYQNTPFPSYSQSSTIGLGAKITLESDDGSQSQYFIGPSAGGLRIHDTLGKLVQVLTPQAPLGAAVMGKMLDDEVMLTIEGVTAYYSVIHIQ